MPIKFGGCVCDRCRRLVFSGLFFLSSVKKTKMHFCSDECKLKFLKGKKYWNRKLAMQNEAHMKLLKLSEKCL